MCGRVRLSSDYSEIKIKLKFDLDAPAPNFEREWNSADPTDAGRHPFGRGQAHAQDDAVGPSSALGEGREDFLLDFQCESRGIHGEAGLQGCVEKRPALSCRDRWFL